MSNTAPIPVDKDDGLYYDYNNALVLSAKIDPDMVLRISNNDAEPIMTIKNDGEVIWHKPHEAGDAADIFCDQIQMRIEDDAGIRQNRKEWEKRITMAIASEAKNAPLGPKELTNVIKKCIMYDKLKDIR